MTEGPYKLPEGWRWVRLGEVCEIASGGTPNRSVSSYWGGDIPWVKISDIPEDGWVSHTEENITMEGLSSSSAKIFPEGTILFSIFATVGKVGILTIKAATNQAIAGLIVVCPDLDRHYVFYALKSVAHHAKIAGRGMAQHNINLTILRNLSIPLPPLEEQRRIVTRIEELMARVREARRLREQAREDAERLWQSVLAETFPRPGSDLPQGWRWVRLGEVCELLIGRTPRKEEYLNENTGTKVLKFRDIMEDGTISWTNHVAGYVKSDFAGRIAEIGDVILTAAAHTPEQIGRKVAYLATIPEEIPKVYFAAELMVLRADKNLLDGRWLTFWLQSEEGYKQIQAHVKEKHLVKTRAKEILLPLPRLDEQRRIVAHLEAVQEKIKALKEAQEDTDTELQRLEQAILEKAFRGEI